MVKIVLTSEDAEMLVDLIRNNVEGYDYPNLHLLAEDMLTNSTIEMEIDE